MHIGLQELQEAKQVSLCQPRARPTTRVALPGLGQTHSGYMRERSQMSTRTLLERRTAPGPPRLTVPTPAVACGGAHGRLQFPGASSKAASGLFPPRKQRLNPCRAPRDSASP